MFMTDLKMYRLADKFERFGLFMELVSVCLMKKLEVQFHDKVSLNDEEIFPIVIYDNKNNITMTLNNWIHVQKKVIDFSERRQHINGCFVTYAMGEDYQAHKNVKTIDGSKVCVIITRNNVYVYQIDEIGTLAFREEYFLDKIYQKFDNYIPLFEKVKPRKEANPTEFAKSLFSTETLSELKDKWVNRGQFEY